jgi:hypothetical protein
MIIRVEKEKAMPECRQGPFQELHEPTHLAPAILEFVDSAVLVGLAISFSIETMFSIF